MLSIGQYWMPHAVHWLVSIGLGMRKAEGQWKEKFKHMGQNPRLAIPMVTEFKPDICPI